MCIEVYFYWIFEKCNKMLYIIRISELNYTRLKVMEFCVAGCFLNTYTFVNKSKMLRRRGFVTFSFSHTYTRAFVPYNVRLHPLKPIKTWLGVGYHYVEHL